MPMLAEVKHMRTAEVPHGFEARSLESESKVLLTVTPQVTTDWSAVTQRDSASRHTYLGVATEGTRAYRMGAHGYVSMYVVAWLRQV